MLRKRGHHVRTLSRLHNIRSRSYLLIPSDTPFLRFSLLDRRPHKVAVCQHLDELTEDGRNIGACNTVIIRKGPNGERKLVGHNTE